MNRFEKFSIAISQISRYWHKIAGDEMEKHGLKGTHAIYLTTMYHHKDGITSADLAELCGKDKSDVSRLVSIMEKKDLVIRRGANKYRALLFLTEKGKKLARHISKLASFVVDLAGKELSDENRTFFYEALENITTNLKYISKNGIKNPAEN